MTETKPTETVPTKKIILLQLIVTAILAVIVFIFMGQNQGASFAFGGIIAAANIYGLMLFSTGLFKKKSVAWSVSIIVLKYTILAILLYFALKLALLDVWWLGMGLVSVMVSFTIFGLLNKDQESNK